ncbi:MAG: site-2 protease family protein, partial [Candidatus Omnitrophota bacterium]
AIAFTLSLVIKSISLPIILLYLFKQAIVVNLVLAVFNLTPIPPLDGSRVVISLLPESVAGKYASIERHGFIILFVLLYLGFFDRAIYPIVKIILNFLNLP